MTTTDQPAMTAAQKRATPPVIVGLAIVPSIPTNHDELAKYALPGGRSTTDRNVARQVAVRIDNLIQTNGGETVLKQRRAA